MKKFFRILILLLLVGTIGFLLATREGGAIWIIEGLNGKSAYELAVENGFSGSLSEWLSSLAGTNGKDGKNGTNGKDGTDGKNGKSAYELAVADGFDGTLHEWLLSLAVSGEAGENGQNGQNGKNGKDGSDGVGVTDVKINAAGRLIVTLSDGRTLDAGSVGDGAGAGSGLGETDEEGFTAVFQMMVMSFRNEDGTSASLNLRSMPDVASPSKSIISTGTELLCVGINGETGWARFVRNEEECYAKSKYFSEKYTYEGTAPTVNFPEKLSLTVGETVTFYTDGIFSELPGDLSVGFSYSGAGVRAYNGSDSFSLTPTWKDGTTAAAHENETAVLTVKAEKAVDGVMKTVAEKEIRVTVKPKKNDLTLTGILIGDSRISDGTVGDALAGEAAGITFLGTRTTGSLPTPHEGRGGWSIADYLDRETVTVGSTDVPNAFYGASEKTDDATGIAHHFDFAGYMSRNGYTELDFAVLQLGANDGYAADAVRSLGVIVRELEAWAKSQGKPVKILIVTEYRSPVSGYYLTGKSNSSVASLRARQFAYDTALEEAFGGKEDVTLIPLHAVVNAWGDRVRSNVTTENGTEEKITDVIHLSSAGYRKEAGMILSELR